MPRQKEGSSHSKTSTSRHKRGNNKDGGSSSKRSGGSNNSRSQHTTMASGGEEDHPDLAELEQRLTEEVDDEFFQDPRKFHTLHRVIDVLGMQLGETPDGSSQHHRDRILEHHNPAYRALKEQQQVVEEAIEHLALIHCADLNGSVVQVGRVARQFHDAVTQVRHLRKQVKEIQETLGAGASGVAVVTGGKRGELQTAATAAASAMSLRELWLKKLEAEAVLSLLDKLDRIRAAPLQFDHYLNTHRIGAAVIVVAQALDTMFSSDVAQVQALHKIMEQLMMRKQRAEEVVWELLMDVLFLRTGNGPAEVLVFGRSSSSSARRRAARDNANLSSGGTSVSGKDSNTIHSNDSKPTKSKAAAAAAAAADNDYEWQEHHGMMNPFLNPKMRFALDYDLQVDSASKQEQQQLLLQEKNAKTNNKANNKFSKQDPFAQEYDFYEDDDDQQNDPLIIPKSTMEAEFDLEQEERRHLEEQSYQQYLDQDNHNNTDYNKSKPHYLDHVLALRTLVECLVRLRRVDDVERIVNDCLHKELSALVEREQARTFLRVETTAQSAKSRSAMLLRKAGASTDLRDFRQHLSSIVSAFGNVQVRLTHLTQIIRHRIMAEKTFTAAYSVPSSALGNVLQSAKDIMESELKDFLTSCLNENQEKEPEFNINALTNVSGQTRQIAKKEGSKKHGLESGLFSLGIIDTKSQKDSNAASADAWLSSSTSSRRSAIQNMAQPKFVQEVLFTKTTQNGTPQIRHALFFRKALSKWQQDTIRLRSQLAKMTTEDTSLPSYNTSATNEIPALEFLDTVIQKELLPVLQEEAVNGTVQALERPDAFDPVLDRNVYARADSNEPQDVDMCRACTALYNFTGPLFLALHRLPKGGDMYLPLVAVLEHVILTFISRVKQQVSRLCNDKTGLQMIMDTTSTGNSKQSFGQVMERRKAFAQLVLAYADGDLLEATVSDEAAGELMSGIPKLNPSGSDTPRNDSKAAALAGMDELDLVGGVEREESNLSLELQFVKPYLEFAGMEYNSHIQTCSDEHLMKAACLSHSLLKLSSLLDSRLKVRSHLGVSTKTLTNTRALREAIKTIKANGLKMSKFCRADVLLQSIVRLSKVCNSSTIVARDAVRIPSSVNDLGEYMTAASDNLREAAGNAVTAYTFSTLEQYIPLCLIQTVRVLAAGKGIVTKAPLTMNGIEALDRSGSVLYRDLKGATSFDNSFWDIELAAVSFERSASFIAMMELEMAELEAYYQENRSDFSEQDFQLMFSMNGPRRKGDIGRYHMLVKRLDKK